MCGEDEAYVQSVPDRMWDMISARDVCQCVSDELSVGRDESTI